MLYIENRGHFRRILESRALEFNEGHDVEIEITCVTNNQDFYRRLLENPSGYDIAVLHLSGDLPRISEKFDTYDFADRLRHNTGYAGKLVAESGAMREHTKEEILEHFDYFTDRLYSSDYLGVMLRDLGFLPPIED